MNILEIKNLTTKLSSDRGIVTAVDNVNLELRKGEILGLVGESGCGKSMTAMSVMRLLPKNQSQIEGEILFDGKDMLKMSEKQVNEIRGNKIAMIFQDVMTSLNPLMTIGQQIMEPMMVHKNMGKSQARKEAIELLEAVGIPMPEKRVDEYPNSLSGGMRQRVMIAIALSCTPEILIADEPTTALDVTIQAQILELMKKIREKYGTSIIMISHDLGVISEMCDRAAVMYCGNIVEQGTIDQIFENPTHPYTRGLLKSIPVLDKKVDELYSIPGIVPPLYDLPSGCKFADRCLRSCNDCTEKLPELREIEEGHLVRCIGGEKVE
ncbi:MAG: ABC transporter ATP-binding protein [Ruminococcaceae bacterium]|nr:ABC transporter ATP-binding protein [Oscillospiraceae bacterium]